MSHTLRYLANCSMLFTEVPLLERPAAAKAAGFGAIEFWWPWPDEPGLEIDDITEFEELAESGVDALTALFANID